MDDVQRQMVSQALGGSDKVYRRGSRGEDVSRIQKFLADRGYDVGAVDGIFGRRTEEAVRQFQMESGLNQDGRVGPDTIAAAKRVSDSPPIPVARPDPMGQPVETPSGNVPNPPQSDMMMGGDRMLSPYGSDDGASDMLDTRPDEMNGMNPKDLLQAAPEFIPPPRELSNEEWLDAKEASWGTPESVSPNDTGGYSGDGDALAESIDMAKAGMSGQPYGNVRAGRRINEYTQDFMPGDGQDDLRAALVRAITNNQKRQAIPSVFGIPLVGPWTATGDGLGGNGSSTFKWPRY